MDFALSKCDKIKEQKLSDDTVSAVHIYMYEDLYIMFSHIIGKLQIRIRNENINRHTEPTFYILSRRQ